MAQTASLNGERHQPTDASIMAALASIADANVDHLAIITDTWGIHRTDLRVQQALGIVMPRA